MRLFLLQKWKKHFTWVDFLESTDNNIGHAVIERGLQELGFSQGSRGKRIAKSWEKARQGFVFLSNKTVFVTSSSLYGGHAIGFDEQGGKWGERLLAFLGRNSRRPALICNLGIGAVLNTVDTVKDLTLDAQRQVQAISANRNTFVWFREPLSEATLKPHLQNDSESLGCPSFALLRRELGDIERLFKLRRVVLTGAAIGIYGEIFPKSLFPTLEFFFIPQSSSERNAEQIDSRKITTVKPTSFDDWSNQLLTIDPDLVIGTRLHGCIIALSLGKNAALISGDMRTAGLAMMAPLPHFSSFDVFNLNLLHCKLNAYNQGLEQILTLVHTQRSVLEGYLGKDFWGSRS